MIALLLFFILLVIVFSIPAVQTTIATRITNSINEKNDVDISLGKIKFTYLGNISMDDVLINDHHQDTLIYARKVNTSVLSLSSMFEVTPLLGNTIIHGLEVNMKIYRGEDKDNLSLFADKFRTDKPTGSPPFQMSSGDVEIINSRYSYIDENSDNPQILSVENLNILGSDLEIDGPDVSLRIENMSGLERRGLEVDFFSALFSYTATRLEMRNMELRTPSSRIVGEIFLDTEEGFGDFVNQVGITAEFKEASMSTNDLQAFYSEFGDDQQMEFTTTMEGTLNNFRLHNVRFQGMDRSVLNGDLIVEQLFAKEDEIFSVQGSLDQLATNYYDLVNLFPGLLSEKLPAQLREFGNVQVQGYAVVTENSLDADVSLFSQLGTADLDLMIGNFDDTSLATYRGNIAVDDFNIGRLVDVPTLEKTSFDLDVDGAGFTTGTMKTEINGNISKLRYNGYTYNSFKILGTLNAPVFNGDLISMDPNLRLEFNGLADFSKKTNVYDFEATVHNADLEALNFISRDSISVFQGDVVMNMRGSNLNDAAGSILLLNTSYQNQNDTYVFDDFRMTSTFDGPVRNIEINSRDVISGEVEGVFDITQVKALFENAVGSLYTNYRPNELTNDQYLEFNFDIYNKIVEVFYPEITLAPNTFIKGRVESDESEFRLTFRSPQIRAFGNSLEKVNIQVDNANPLFNTFMEVDSVATDVYDLSEFNLINVTMNDTLFVRSEFRGGKQDDDIFNLNLYHTINQENNSVIGVQKSDITFKHNLWYINEFNNQSNRIVFENGFSDMRVDSLVLSHQEEEIRLNGQMKDSTSKDFNLRFDNVDLGKISPDIENLEMGGVVNGNLHLLQRNGAYYPNSSLTVRSLEVNEHSLGHLNLDVMGNKDLTFYNINTSLRKDGLESLSAIGEIVVDEETPQINLDVVLRNFNLVAFSPLGGETIDNMRGLVSGNAYVSGNYRNPDIRGSLRLDDAGMRIPYLNVDLDFDQNARVNLVEQQFRFDNIGISDTKYGTAGVLSGTISHQNFSQWRLGLNVSTDRLLVLDTEADEDALYYGTAFIAGNASIYGPTDELVINVNASTERGTVFKIPIDDTESIGDNSFIYFLSPEEKAARRAGEEIVMQEVKGLEMNFDLDVTSDALVEIDMDGSILRGKGAGTLLIEINTLGKFNMWGDFIANSGEYIFNYGALQKRFEVRPGGSINWSGNPAQADLDISAVYEALANPALILENPSVSRRIPVDVVINLEGDLLKPDFNFDLEYPNVTAAVRSELEYKIETSANTEMQAFSLLALGQFYTQNVLQNNTGNAWAGNLFESASGFFNNLLSDENGVFQVGLNYEQGARTPEQSTADRFGVTLSTQISERVLINGQVGVPVGGVTETVVVGNLEIEFLLNEEGNLRAKIFNRENNIQYIGEELGFTQGVGLTYQVDFDTFQELIQKILQKENSIAENGQREKDEDEDKDSPKDLAPDYIRFPGSNEID